LIRKATAILLLLPSLVLAAEPKAVVSGPKQVPAGSIVFLDASLSQSDKPLKWRTLGNPAPLIPLDKDDRKGVYAIVPTLPPGTHRFAVVAIGTPDKATEPDADIAIVEVVVGDPQPVPQPQPTPTPGPTPPPAPTPSPAPTDPFGKMGYDYGKAIATTYAETFEESASMLAAGLPKSTVNSDFDKRWKKRRDAAFASVAAEFARIAPDDREPNGDEKARLAQAWREFAKGLKSR